MLSPKIDLLLMHFKDNVTTDFFVAKSQGLLRRYVWKVWGILIPLKSRNKKKLPFIKPLFWCLEVWNVPQQLSEETVSSSSSVVIYIPYSPWILSPSTKHRFILSTLWTLTFLPPSISNLPHATYTSAVLINTRAWSYCSAPVTSPLPVGSCRTCCSRLQY